MQRRDSLFRDIYEKKPQSDNYTETKFIANKIIANRYA